MLLQKEHDVLHLFLTLPALGYHLDALLSDSRHLNQDFDIVFDDRKGIDTELLYDFPGVYRAHPFDQSAAQIFLHAVDSGRKGLLPFFGHELLSVPGIHLPVPLHQKHGAHIRVQKVPNHCDQIVISLDMDSQNRVAVFRILVCNSLYDAPDCHSTTLLLSRQPSQTGDSAHGFRHPARSLPGIRNCLQITDASL